MTDLDSNDKSSKQPSKQPSSQTSNQTSKQPSKQPSNQTSKQPSNQTSKQPSDDENDSKKRLLILDMNGLVCRKIYKPDYDEDNPVSDKYERLELGSCYVFIRPDVRDFLEKCFELADIAFWSSTTYYNAKHILDHILTESQQSNVIFKWYRDRTKLDPTYGIDHVTNNYDTIKDLNDVWDSPVINRNRFYNSSNTIICDDDHKKVRLNNKDNIIMVTTFDPWESEYDNTVMNDLLEKIEDQLPH